ncbi:hypothetical protein [Duganella sp. Root336D2]|uniref:hypothetical protein n=1 Tax=Duganella sp. Root336D2 TaxID=1736518 RepID=UPI0006FAC0FC|nr:hypothetical protein [Duganella sp. Root336D2]KQV42988.1 hypothetical protein ASD07_21340 [Duganella sp. Root336D2]
MNAQQALAFVEQHGVVLASAHGKVPTLTEAIAGAPIKGSWWGHAEGKRIFAVLSEVQGHGDILACRLLAGKLTLVHRRLWPAVAALAGELPAAAVARVRQLHTAGGKHVNEETPFPQWLPLDAALEAEAFDPVRARAALGL